MVVLRQPAAVVLGDHRTLGDRHQRIVRVEILARQEEGFVGGDQRQVMPVGEIDGGSLQRTVVAGQPLDLDVKPVAEQVLERQQPLFGELRMVAFERAADRPPGSAGQADDAVGEAVEDFERQMHGGLAMRFEIGAADEAHQIAVAGLVGGDQHQREQLRTVTPRDRARALLAHAREREIELAGDDRLHALLHRLLSKFERAEQIVGVGDGNGGRRILGSLRDHLRQRQRALKQRIGGMHAQMHERARRPCSDRHQLAPQRVAWKFVVRHGSGIARKGLGDHRECMIRGRTKPAPERPVPSAMLTNFRYFIPSLQWAPGTIFRRARRASLHTSAC